MTRSTLRVSFLWMVVMACVLGCWRSPSSKYYLLAPGEGTAGTPRAELTVAVGPVTFPAYLDRTDIVRRTGQTEIELWTDHRWAERPVTNFSSVLADNLVTLVGTSQVVQHPWSTRVSPDVILYADVANFELDSNGTALLVVAWTLERGNGAASLIRRSRYESKAKGKSPALVIEAMSRALFSFSQDVAAAIAREPAAQIGASP